MILANSLADPYQIKLTAGERHVTADATKDKGGRGEGFRPHELLEASLAACSAMMVRMVAEKDKMPLREVKVAVEVDRKTPGETIFRSKITLEGDLTESQRQKLLAAAQACPVKKTLSRKISFVIG